MNSIQTFLSKKEYLKPIPYNRTYLAKEELEAVLDSLVDDEITTETVREKFEKLFCEILNFRYGVAVHSRTGAYHLAFLSLGISKENTVWASNLSPVALLDATKYVGAGISLIEIDRNSFFPDPQKLRDTVELMKEGDVFIADYTFGAFFPYPFDELKRKKVRIIEDITGILGYQIAGTGDKPVSIGKESIIQICGLYSEDIITTGKGAIILTEDSSLVKNIQEISYSRYRNPDKLAYDYLLEDFQSAMGIHQINKIANLVARRKKIGQKYLETLRKTPHETYFQYPHWDNYHRFPVVFTRKQEEVIRHFTSLKIEVQKIPVPLHRYLQLPANEFPNSERLYKKSVCLPLYPMLNSTGVERITNGIRSIL